MKMLPISVRTSAALLLLAGIAPGQSTITAALQPEAARQPAPGFRIQDSYGATKASRVPGKSPSARFLGHVVPWLQGRDTLVH